MATRVDLLTEAHWQAREHAAECDALTATQWLACLARAWRRLWNAHPEAFHVDGELVGQLPDLPGVDATALPLLPEWLDVLAVGTAADAVRAIATEDPQQAVVMAEFAQSLEQRFIRGVGA